MEAILNRRKFAGYSAIGALSLCLGSMLSTAACTFDSVYTAILKYVGVGLRAFQAVVDLLAGAGVIPVGGGVAIDAVIALVKAAFADLQTAIETYEAAPADQKTTLLGKISTALSVVEASIQQFWNDLSIPDGKLASLVQGLLGIILSTLAGFASSLPTPAPTPVAAKSASLPKRITVAQPKKRSTGEFKKEFNQELQAAGFAQYALR